MKQVQKSVLLWYAPQEMYALVTDVRSYPQFLPWCQRVEVLSEDDTHMTARLHLSYAGVKQAFTTRNEQDPGQRVTLTLVDGPFSKLEGCWRFIGIGQPSPDGSHRACKVEFELSYAFSSRPLELVVSPVFDRIANTFVDAFVARAEAVYGPR